MTKEVTAFFDRLAPNWDNDMARYHIREKIISLANIPTGSEIIDIGCGAGVMFEHLLKTNPSRIIAIDISSEMISIAKKSFSDSRITYINGDILEASLPPLDAAIIFNAYPHFLDKPALVKKLATTIKPDGILVIAHSMSKELINGVHDGEVVSTLSMPLEEAHVEATRFDEFFLADTLIDNDEFYFIKMIRRKRVSSIVKFKGASKEIAYDFKDELERGLQDIPVEEVVFNEYGTVNKNAVSDFCN